jgi:hypothetical protein
MTGSQAAATAPCKAKGRPREETALQQLTDNPEPWQGLTGSTQGREDPTDGQQNDRGRSVRQSYRLTAPARHCG